MKQLNHNLNKFAHTKSIFDPLFWDKKKYEYTTSNSKYSLNNIKIISIFHLLSLCGVAFGMIQFLSLSLWCLGLFGFVCLWLVIKMWQVSWNILQQKQFNITHHDSLISAHWDYTNQSDVTIFVNNCLDDLDIIRRCLLTVSKLKYNNYKVIFLDQTHNSKIWTICNIFNFEYIPVDTKNYVNDIFLSEYVKKSTTKYNLVLDSQIELHPNYLIETIPYLGFYDQVKCHITTSGDDQSIVFKGYGSWLEDQTYDNLNSRNHSLDIHNSIFDKAILDIDKNNIKAYNLPLCLCFGQCSSNIVNYLQQNQIKFQIKKISIFTWFIVFNFVMAIVLLCFGTKLVAGGVLLMMFPYILVSIIFHSFFKINKHSLENFIVSGAGLYYTIYSNLVNKNDQNFVYFINGIGVVLTIWMYIMSLEGLLFRGINSLLPSLIVISFYFINIGLIVFINYNLNNIFHQYEFREFNNKIVNWKKRHNQFRANFNGNLSNNLSNLNITKPIINRIN